MATKLERAEQRLKRSKFIESFLALGGIAVIVGLLPNQELASATEAIFGLTFTEIASSVLVLDALLLLAQIYIRRLDDKEVANLKKA